MHVAVAIREPSIQEGLIHWLRAIGHDAAGLARPTAIGPDAVIVDQCLITEILRQLPADFRQGSRPVVLLTDGSPLQLDHSSRGTDIRLMHYPIVPDELERCMDAIKVSLDER